MMLPVPLHTGHVRATEKNPCCERICPRPPHCWQVSGCLPSSDPVPRAVVAHFRAADLDLPLLAEHRLFELQLHVVLQVAATLRARRAALSAHVEHLAEQVAEDVAQIALALERAAAAKAAARR